MKSLTTTLPLSLAIAGLVGTIVSVLPLEAADRSSAFIGAIAGGLLGALVLVLKTAFGGMGLKGTAAIKALVTAQGLSFLLRLIVVGVGAFALKGQALSPIAYVIAFFAVSLPQQALETRSLLRGATPLKSSEVIS